MAQKDIPASLNDDQLFQEEIVRKLSESEVLQPKEMECLLALITKEINQNNSDAKDELNRLKSINEFYEYGLELGKLKSETMENLKAVYGHAPVFRSDKEKLSCLLGLYVNFLELGGTFKYHLGHKVDKFVDSIYSLKNSNAPLPLIEILVQEGEKRFSSLLENTMIFELTNIDIKPFEDDFIKLNKEINDEKLNSLSTPYSETDTKHKALKKILCEDFLKSPLLSYNSAYFLMFYLKSVNDPTSRKTNLDAVISAIEKRINARRARMASFLLDTGRHKFSVLTTWLCTEFDNYNEALKNLKLLHYYSKRCKQKYKKRIEEKPGFPSNFKDLIKDCISFMEKEFNETLTPDQVRERIRKMVQTHVDGLTNQRKQKSLQNSLSPKK